MSEQLEGSSPENLVALPRQPSVDPGGWQRERPFAAVATLHPPAERPAARPYVSFVRQELNDILRVYGRMVAAGEWRDYAIDTLEDKAVFSVFRRSTEMPLYRIEKDPRLARRQGAYAVVAQSGLILKRGPELDRVLAVFDKQLIKLAE